MGPRPPAGRGAQNRRQTVGRLQAPSRRGADRLCRAAGRAGEGLTGVGVPDWKEEGPQEYLLGSWVLMSATVSGRNDGPGHPETDSRPTRTNAAGGRISGLPHVAQPEQRTPRPPDKQRGPRLENRVESKTKPVSGDLPAAITAGRESPSKHSMGWRLCRFHSAFGFLSLSNLDFIFHPEPKTDQIQIKPNAG